MPKCKYCKQDNEIVHENYVQFQKRNAKLESEVQELKDTIEQKNQFIKDTVKEAEEEIRDLKDDFYHEKVQLTERIKREINRWKEFKEEIKKLQKENNKLKDEMARDDLLKKNRSLKKCLDWNGIKFDEEMWR